MRPVAVRKRQRADSAVIGQLASGVFALDMSGMRPKLEESGPVSVDSLDDLP